MSFTIKEIVRISLLYFQKRKISILLFSVLLVSNFVLFYYLLDNHGLTLDNPTKIEGDSHDYINSSENLLNGKGFTFQRISQDDQFVSNFQYSKILEKQLFYSFRTPGFSFFYIPMRVFFNKENSILLFVLLQTILNALAKFCLVLIIHEYTKSKFLSTTAYLSLCTIPYFSQYNNLLLTDSLGLSFLIFAFYYLNRAINEDFKKKYVLFSGIFFTIAIFLRPFLILTFIFAILLLFLIQLKKHSVKKNIAIILYFCSSFILVDSFWIIRNFMHTNTFIPLASTMHFQDHKHLSFKEIKMLSGNLGLSINWWDVTSPVSWYLNKNDLRKIEEVIPNSVLSNQQKNAIVNSRKLLEKSLDKSIDSTQRKIFEKKSELLLNQINCNLLENHFFQTQVFSRIKILFNFLTQPIPRDFRDITPEYRGKIIFINHFIVNFTIWGGVIFLIYIWFLKGFYVLKFLSICSLGLISFFSLLHLSYEYRELYTLTGFLMIGSFMLLELISSKGLIVKLLVISILILVCVGSYYQSIPEL